MARIFIGNLPTDIRESELDDLFYKYGRIRDIDIKNPSRPPAYAFISFSDYRDAEDAVRGRDGYNFDGHRLRVELAKGSRGSDRDGGRDVRDRGRTQRRSDYGLIVTGLPRGASWQDLKDNMRKYGDVIYTDVGRDGEGVVEFSNRDDMEHALRNADNSEFRSNRADPTNIHVKARNDSDNNRGRSPSRSRDRDDRDRRSRSRDRNDDRDRRSPSRSYSRDRRSRSRSRSRSRDRSYSADRTKGGRDEER